MDWFLVLWTYGTISVVLGIVSYSLQPWYYDWRYRIGATLAVLFLWPLMIIASMLGR